MKIKTQDPKHYVLLADDNTQPHTTLARLMDTNSSPRSCRLLGQTSYNRKLDRNDNEAEILIVAAWIHGADLDKMAEGAITAPFTALRQTLKLLDAVADELDRIG